MYLRVCYTLCGCSVNGIGAEGAASLSKALKCCFELRELNLIGELLVACVR